MKLPSYQWIGQMLAASGVVLSLVLVAYELKLSRDTAKADIYQQSAAMTMEYHASLLANEPFQEALYKQYGESSELSHKEIFLIVDAMDGWMWQKEAQYYQYQIGMSDAVEWANHRRQIKKIGGAICYREWWNRSGKYAVRDDFAAEVEQAWADLPESECPLWSESGDL